jgi:hypothetical protein
MVVFDGNSSQGTSEAYDYSLTGSLGGYSLTGSLGGSVDTSYMDDVEELD